MAYQATAVTLNDKYLSATCSVKSMNGELLATGTLVTITPEYLEITDPVNRLPLIPYRTVVNLGIIRGNLPTYFGMGRVYVSTDDILRIVEYATVNNFEQRKAFRVPVQLRGKLWKADEGGSAGGRDYGAEALDLSLTGTFIYADTALEVGERFEVMLNLPRDYFRFNCIVRRKYVVRGREGYGCAFEDMTGPMSDKLCAFLFRAQGEQLRKTRVKR